LAPPPLQNPEEGLLPRLQDPDEEPYYYDALEKEDRTQRLLDKFDDIYTHRGFGDEIASDEPEEFSEYRAPAKASDKLAVPFDMDLDAEEVDHGDEEAEEGDISDLPASELEELPLPTDTETDEGGGIPPF